MTNDKSLVASDPNGLRPLTMGRLGDAYIFTSETCALEVIGAEAIRDVAPGELLILIGTGFGKNGIRKRDAKRCARWSIFISPVLTAI